MSGEQRRLVRRVLPGQLSGQEQGCVLTGFLCGTEHEAGGVRENLLNQTHQLVRVRLAPASLRGRGDQSVGVQCGV